MNAAVVGIPVASCPYGPNVIPANFGVRMKSPLQRCPFRAHKLPIYLSSCLSALSSAEAVSITLTLSGVPVSQAQLAEQAGARQWAEDAMRGAEDAVRRAETDRDDALRAAEMLTGRLEATAADKSHVSVLGQQELRDVQVRCVCV